MQYEFCTIKSICFFFPLSGRAIESFYRWDAVPAIPTQELRKKPAYKPTYGLMDQESHKFHMYVAKLFYKTSPNSSYYLSSATIINNKKLVTAAQNVASAIKIVLSFNSLTAEDNKYKIKVNLSEVSIHPEYDEKSNFANDIAVIELKKPLKNVEGIKMVDKKYRPNYIEEVAMLGYSNGLLSYIRTKPVDFVQCRYAYYKVNNKRLLEDGKQFCLHIADRYIQTGWIGGL